MVGQRGISGQLATSQSCFAVLALAASCFVGEVLCDDGGGRLGVGVIWMRRLGAGTCRLDRRGKRFSNRDGGDGMFDQLTGTSTNVFFF